MMNTSPKSIGLIVPHLPEIFRSVYYTNVMAGVSDALIGSGYELKVLLRTPDTAKVASHDFKACDGVDGLVMTQWFRFFSDATVFDRMDIPCVHINDSTPDVRTHFVCEDGVSGGALAAKHLHEIGYREVGVITGAAWSIDSRHRLDGFKKAWASFGLSLSEERVVAGDFDEEPVTHAAVDALLAKDVRAVFCCNDTMAFMTIRRLKERGLRCPDDVAVMGYDDDARGATFDPPLTTVRVSVYDVAKAAAEQLLAYLASGNVVRAHEETLTQVTLIERRSG
jgi:DNA-binding LacI/PurR family transcriptional regulator